MQPHPLWAAAAALTLAACASAPGSGTARGGTGAGSALGREAADAQGRIPRPLAPFIAADRQEGPRNAVLNAMLAGKTALDLGAPAQARALLDAAYQRIEVIYADNAAAREARSKFAPEARKDFKGEPYERAMVGYYLGLADLLLGDLDNARSAFRWGEFQDTLSAAEQYQGDMASLQYLVGWVHHCQGRRRDADEALALARRSRAALPALGSDDNLLVVVEAGPAPVKLRAGKHGEALTYAEPAVAAPTGAQVMPAGAAPAGAPALQAVLAEDLHWQASTLGGRQVDYILAGKASFKDTATNLAAAGHTAAIVGTEVLRTGAAYGDRHTANVGGVLALGGLLTSLVSSAVASATRPEADTRSWHNLPAALYFASARIPHETATGWRLQAAVPSPWAGAPALAAPRPIPGTPCLLARLRPGGDDAAWDAAAPGAWVALADAERGRAATPPAAAAAGPSAAAAPRSAEVPPPSTPPPRTAPVRASF